jgi:hypothetical protein
MIFIKLEELIHCPYVFVIQAYVIAEPVPPKTVPVSSTNWRNNKIQNQEILIQKMKQEHVNE